MLGDAEVLRASGHEVTVAFDTRRPGNLREACRARDLPIAEGLKLSRVSGPWESWRDVVALRRSLVAGVDLVHTHFSHDHHLALLAARGLHARVRIVRSLEAEGTGSLWALRRTDGLELPFEALAQSERLRGMGERVAVLPSAVDPERFSPGRSSKLRHRMGLGLDAALIGIVARLKPERRHAELIEAFAHVVAKAPQARLVIIGRGEGQAALERQVADLGLQNLCLFAGYWEGDDLVEAYRGLDLAVWLANGNDGGARGVLEAMAIGLPVVAYATPPMSEQLTEGCGVLVPAGDTGQLAVRLGDLVQDIGLRAAIGARAREQVLARYTWEQRGPALLAFYARVRGLPAAR
jgi:glycosyltransferase involved in cell wall biosynthesis